MRGHRQRRRDAATCQGTARAAATGSWQTQGRDRLCAHPSFRLLASVRGENSAALSRPVCGHALQQPWDTGEAQLRGGYRNPAWALPCLRRLPPGAVTLGEGAAAVNLQACRKGPRG